MKKIILVITLLLVSLVSSYVYCEIIKPYSSEEELIREHSPMLTIEYIIEKAKEHARSKGRKLEDYFVSVVKYDSSKKRWLVSFEGKLPVPGNHFGIFIEDRTEKTEYFPGE